MHIILVHGCFQMLASLWNGRASVHPQLHVSTSVGTKKVFLFYLPWKGPRQDSMVGRTDRRGCKKCKEVSLTCFCRLQSFFVSLLQYYRLCGGGGGNTGVSISYWKGGVCLSSRETRDGWPLLSVETEAKGTQRVHMKGVLPWLVGWARRSGTRSYCPASAATVSAVQNIFIYIYFFLTAAASWAGSRAASPFSQYMCLWSSPTKIPGGGGGC